MRHLLVMLFLSLGLGGVSAAPAHADIASPATDGASRLVCQMDSPPLREALQSADVVASGTVQKRTRDPQRPEDYLLYTIRVDRVFSGTAPRTIELRTPITTEACGLTRLERNRDYLIAAHESRGQLTALSTEGSGPFDGPRRAMVIDMFGNGDPPTAPAPSEDPDQSEIPQVTRTAVDSQGAPSFSSVAWPGAVFLGAGLVIFLIALLFGRRRQH